MAEQRCQTSDASPYDRKDRRKKSMVMDFVKSALTFVIMGVCIALICANRKKEEKEENYMLEGMALGMFAFLAISVWMFENGKAKFAWMPLIPGGWYAFVTVTYIANAKIGFNIPWTAAYVIGVIAAVVYIGVVIWYARKRMALQKK